MSFFGRRTLYVGGMAFMSFMLWIIGGLGFKPGQSSIMAIGSLLIALNFIYNVRSGLSTFLTHIDPSVHWVHCVTRSSVKCRRPVCDRSRSPSLESLTRL